MVFLCKEMRPYLMDIEKDPKSGKTYYSSRSRSTGRNTRNMSYDQINFVRVMQKGN